jgi:hypothetical protein
MTTSPPFLLLPLCVCLCVCVCVCVYAYGCVCMCVCVCVGVCGCVTKKKAQAEKISRGALKTAVERGLTRTETLIADDLNYIKGYRYEVCVCVRARGFSDNYTA